MRRLCLYQKILLTSIWYFTRNIAFLRCLPYRWVFRWSGAPINLFYRGSLVMYRDISISMALVDLSKHVMRWRSGSISSIFKSPHIIERRTYRSTHWYSLKIYLLYSSNCFDFTLLIILSYLLISVDGITAVSGYYFAFAPIECFRMHFTQ